ncbi:hypothetical protein WDW37_08845 [Bdellovibrionota bacterium FG-1]
MAKLRFRISSEFFSFVLSALIFGALGAGIVAIGFGMVYRVLERENRAALQQSLSDTVSIQASRVQLEFERAFAALSEVGPEKFQAPSIETLAEITDLSLWKKSETSGGLPVRAAVALNSHSRFSSPAWAEKIQARESIDRSRLEAAFRGQRVVLSESLPGVPTRMAWIALPRGHGEVQEVVVGRLSLDKIQKIFSEDRPIDSAVLDRNGDILASDGRVSQSVLLSFLEPGRSPAAPLSPANPVDWGYRKWSEVGLTVIASVSPLQVRTSVDDVKRQLFIFVVLIFLGMGGGRFWFLQKNRIDKTDRRLASVASADQDGAPGAVSGLPQSEASTGGVADLTSPPNSGVPQNLEPHEGVFAVLHGSLRGFSQLLEGLGSQEAAEVLNDYFTVVAGRVRAQGGHFERFSGLSFVGSWELPVEGEADRLGSAISCALLLREDFARYNEGRKVDGKRPVAQGLALHVSRSFAARLGPAGEMNWCVTGEAAACARALDRLGFAADRDMLVSHEVVRAARGTFAGTVLGEARLTSDTGLTPYYAVHAYHEYLQHQEHEGVGIVDEPDTLDTWVDPPATARSRQTSSETRVEIMIPEAVESRWMVNNGSRIEGPYDELELAQQLFAQELDFDSECWSEDDGHAAPIKDAGMFSGSNEKDARFWVFDGKTMHGPLTEGLLRTAAEHDALGSDVFVCEESTVHGWLGLSEFLVRLASAEKPESHLESSAA